MFSVLDKFFPFIRGIEQAFAGPGDVADGIIERRKIVQIFIFNFNQGPVCAGETQ